jgi:hypothetical protein
MFYNSDSDFIERFGEQEYTKFSEAYREAIEEINDRISCVGLSACAQFADIIALSCMIETPDEFESVSSDLSDPDISEIVNAKLAEEFSLFHQSTKHSLIERFNEKSA